MRRTGYGRVLECAVKEMGCNRKEFSPEGIMAKGTGARLADPWKFLDSNHAPRRGS
jgi:hypothetical protein